MKFLLKLKHWQLFIPAGGLFILIHISSIFISVFSAHDFLFSYLAYVFPPLMILTIATLFAWIYGLVKEFSAEIPSDINPSQKWFKILFTYSLSYMFILFILMGIMFSGKGFEEKYVFIILPFHFLAMFCNIYIFWFAGRTLKMAEVKRKVTFSEYAGEFFLMLFFYIGIWILQPRVNKMIQEKN